MIRTLPFGARSTSGLRTASTSATVGWALGALVTLAFLLGLGLAYLGDTLHPLAMFAPLVLVTAGFLLARRPIWVVGLLLALLPLGLREVAGGLRLVHVMAFLTFGAVLLLRPRALVLTRGVRAPLVWAALLGAAALAATMASEYPIQAGRMCLNLFAGLLVCWAVQALGSQPAPVGSSRADGEVPGGVGSLRTLLRAAVTGGLVLTIPALASMGKLRMHFGGTAIEGRLQGALPQPNDFGQLAAMLLFVSVAFYLLAGGPGDRLLALAGIGLCLLGSVLSFSRGAWLGIAVGVLCALVLAPRMLRVAAVALAVLLVLTPLAVLTPAARNVADVVVARVSSADGTNPDDRRDLIWAEGIRQVGRAPWLGHGPAAFLRISTAPGSRIASYRRLHAHNLVLNVAVETGILGVGALAGLTFSMALLVRRTTVLARRIGRPQLLLATVCLSSAQVVVAAHGLVDLTYMNPVLMVAIWAMLGLTLAAVARLRAEHPGGQPERGQA